MVGVVVHGGHDDDDAGGGDDCAPRVAERLEPVQYGGGDDVPETLAAVAAHCRDLWDQRTVSLSDAAQREKPAVFTMCSSPTSVWPGAIVQAQAVAHCAGRHV